MAIINGNNENNVLLGTQFHDEIFGFAGDDILLGLGGNDSLNGGNGSDILFGGNGNDALRGDAGNDILLGQAGNDNLYGGDGNDSLNGGDGNDYLHGDAGNDYLHGGLGDDRLEGGAGYDNLYGRLGNDNLNGGNGNDFLNGGDGNDYLVGDNGSDRDGGNDYLYGDLGNDYLYGGVGDDSLEGGAGNDGLEGATGNDILYGASGNDILYGGYLSSGDGNDNGGRGNDTLYGHIGYDELYGGDGNDVLYGGTDGDTLDGGTGSDKLYGEQDNDYLTGRDGNDSLYGDEGNDSLLGERGNDSLSGGSGFDTLTGSRFTVAGEIDTLTGGAGSDKFILGNASWVLYDDGNTATAGKSNYALITDFNRTQDVLQLYGSKNRYYLATSGSGLPQGTAIYFDKPDGEQDELIGIVHGISGLSLHDDGFSFTSAEFNLSELNGSNGFVINGIDAHDASGYSVSVGGDFNGDGFDDLIIGAPFAEQVTTNFGSARAGESYVVFGAAGFDASLNLSSLNGSNGFVIKGFIAEGEYGSSSGFSVSFAGDINSDGLDDLIIGAPDAGTDTSSGKSYVVFGREEGFDASFSLSDLNGSNGFVINGIGYELGNSGSSVSSAGDFNADGFDDLVIGAPMSPQYGSGGSGESYVIFGRAGGFSASLDLEELDGSNGFTIFGIDDYDLSGTSVSCAGDINADGFDDLMIGAPSKNGEYLERNDPGQTYVVFGLAGGFGASFNLSDLNGSNGFVINGIDANDRAGRSVSSGGDFNGDGFSDLIIGAPGADPNGKDGAGKSYVVFGHAGGFDASLDLSALNGSNGFAINGIDRFDSSGPDFVSGSVSLAGDLNSDGFDDLVIGASGADPNGQDGAGKSYVVFGQAGGFGASLNLCDLNGRNGFVINGIDANDRSGGSVSAAGDLNSDGFDDLVIGASGDFGSTRAGESYMIFGRDFTGQVTNPGTSGNDWLTGTSRNDILIGGLGNDTLIGGEGQDVLKGSGGNDTLSYDAADRRISGGSGTDTLRIDGRNVNLNLTIIFNNKLTEFECIDLTGTGNNSLTFNLQDVLALSDTTNQLIVNGNAGDRVTSTGLGWTRLSTTLVDDILYHRYTLGAATLLVDADITANIT